MITCFSSRREQLDSSFINRHLANAVAYDRIAGYFRSSMLEVAGEQIESMQGKDKGLSATPISIPRM